jgi:nicotinamidase-related amidase
MVKVSDKSALVVIDVQKAWSESGMESRNNPDAESKISMLLSRFRANGRTIIHIRHDSLNPGSIFKEGKPTFEFKEEAKPIPGELVITKHVNSAFIGTDLENILRKLGNQEVFYVGLVTDHCVSTTVRMSGNLGFKSFVIEDGCATFDREDSDGSVIPAEQVHKVNLASINGEFASIVKSDDLKF